MDQTRATFPAKDTANVNTVKPTPALLNAAPLAHPCERACAICLRGMSLSLFATTTVLRPCGHSFHTHCIAGYFQFQEVPECYVCFTHAARADTGAWVGLQIACNVAVVAERRLGGEAKGKVWAQRVPAVLVKEEEVRKRQLHLYRQYVNRNVSVGRC